MKYVNFDFKKFEQKPLLDQATLGGLGALGEGMIDFVKYYNKFSDGDRILLEERAYIIGHDNCL